MSKTEQVYVLTREAFRRPPYLYLVDRNLIVEVPGKIVRPPASSLREKELVDSFIANGWQCTQTEIPDQVLTEFLSKCKRVR